MAHLCRMLVLLTVGLILLVSECVCSRGSLFLTPYIESGGLDEARKLSRVEPLDSTPSLESYSGFLTVNKKYNSNLFFWFFPAQLNPATAPVLLWLQGGPGSTSLIGLFVEHGPYEVGADNVARLRNYTWTKYFSMIYIDNPVGAGFSFTEHEKGYARNQDDVANDMYEALQQFFTLFSEYRSNDFYVTGESYAGKHVPSIAYKIHAEGANSNINLKGISIGNGICDPVSQINYADFVYQIGLVDSNQAKVMRKQQDKIVQYIENDRYKEAYYALGDLIRTSSYFRNFSGYNYYFNILLSEAPPSTSYYLSYVQKRSVRKAIHVGNLPFNEADTVKHYLLHDMMKSIKSNITVLLDSGYKVLFYTGQLDIRVAYPLASNFIASIPWKGAKDFNSAPRMIWYLNRKQADVAGYVRQVGNFTEALVRNSGHMVPYDQPEAALDLITRFIFGNQLLPEFK